MTSYVYFAHEPGRCLMISAPASTGTRLLWRLLGFVLVVGSLVLGILIRMGVL